MKSIIILITTWRFQSGKILSDLLLVCYNYIAQSALATPYKQRSLRFVLQCLMIGPPAMKLRVTLQNNSPFLLCLVLNDNFSIGKVSKHVISFYKCPH